MSLLAQAVVVDDETDEPTSESTLIMNRKGTTYVTYVMVALIMMCVAVFVGYRLYSGTDAAVATAAPQTETVAAMPVAAAAASPDVCQGDLSKAGPQLKWYCNDFMPWKSAVDAKLDRLDRHGGGMPPWAMTVLILSVVLNLAVGGALVARRRG